MVHFEQVLWIQAGNLHYANPTPSDSPTLLRDGDSGLSKSPHKKGQLSFWEGTGIYLYIPSISVYPYSIPIIGRCQVPTLTPCHWPSSVVYKPLPSHDPRIPTRSVWSKSCCRRAMEDVVVCPIKHPKEPLGVQWPLGQEAAGKTAGAKKKGCSKTHTRMLRTTMQHWNMFRLSSNFFPIFSKDCTTRRAFIVPMEPIAETSEAALNIQCVPW